MTTFCVYRGAMVCGRIGCAEVLDRHGRCPDGHCAIPEWSDDAEEIEVDVSGTPYAHKGSSTEPDDCGVDDVCAEFEGKPFALSADEVERFTQALWEEFVDRPRYDDSKDDEREWR